ncbi:MAG: prolyl oligopeptidase family serine peptidase [Ignavibacteria bacterium]|nr:prolyl oligopeptidase family serine peptidase [Ignavibacteria bacterium]
MIKDFILKTSKGNQLQVSTFVNEMQYNGNAIIFAHGFKGFKDWGFGPYLGNFFANGGFIVVTFNFSHNGIGINKTEFTELEKFADNTFTLEVSELDEIIDFLKTGHLEIEFNGKVGLLGHSRGGAISLLTASKRIDINGVALWASISKLDRYSERQKVIWRKNGYFEILNTRTNQQMRLNVSLLDDIEKNANGSLNLEKSVRNLGCPLLIAHGDQDLAVPIAEAEQIYDWADKSKTEFYKIFGTGHTFDIIHPFNGTNEKFEKLLKKTSEFFQRNLT